MITHAQMYWLTRLDPIIEIGATLVVLAIVMFIAGCIYITAATDGPSDEKVGPLFRSTLKWSLPTFLVGLSVLTFLPSTKQMAAIWLVPSIVNNEKVQTVGNKLYDLAVEWMGELRPTKEKTE